jgi:hypothetical protein
VKENSVHANVYAAAAAAAAAASRRCVAAFEVFRERMAACPEMYGRLASAVEQHLCLAQPEGADQCLPPDEAALKRAARAAVLGTSHRASHGSSNADARSAQQRQQQRDCLPPQPNRPGSHDGGDWEDDDPWDFVGFGDELKGLAHGRSLDSLQGLLQRRGTLSLPQSPVTTPPRMKAMHLSSQSSQSGGSDRSGGGSVGGSKSGVFSRSAAHGAAARQARGASSGAGSAFVGPPVLLRSLARSQSATTLRLLVDAPQRSAVAGGCWEWPARLSGGTHSHVRTLGDFPRV